MKIKATFIIFTGLFFFISCDQRIDSNSSAEENSNEISIVDDSISEKSFENKIELPPSPISVINQRKARKIFNVKNSLLPPGKDTMNNRD